MGLVLGVVAARELPWPLSLALLAATFMVCALICGRAERHLGQHDPPAVILDEVWGMLAVFVVLPWTGGSVPLGLVAFLMFRAFDVAKPPPVQWLARLPGGWGIMADDLGASIYTVLILWAAHTYFGF